LQESKLKIKKLEKTKLWHQTLGIQVQNTWWKTETLTSN
jgi:acyl-coenzyme A synthetase/AMP-(fatty) acid ligase